MIDNVVRNKLSKKINSLSFDKEELKKLIDILQERSKASGDIELKILELHTLDNSDKSQSLEKAKENLIACIPLKISIKGFHGEELFGTVSEVFNSVSFPEAVKSVYLNSDVLYRSQFNYYPQNSFQLLIDFSKPNIFDFSFQPNEKTPNESVFIVEGSDSTWVNGVFYEIDSFIKTRSSKFSSVHRGNVYNILMWLFGIPFGFWICYKLLFLNLKIFDGHSFLEGLLFTYCFLVSLFILQIVFYYFRWVYPMVEYRDKKNRSILHQAALFSIIIGIIGKFFYDIVKLIFAT